MQLVVFFLTFSSRKPILSLVNENVFQKFRNTLQSNYEKCFTYLADKQNVFLMTVYFHCKLEVQKRSISVFNTEKTVRDLFYPLFADILLYFIDESNIFRCSLLEFQNPVHKRLFIVQKELNFKQIKI